MNTRIALAKIIRSEKPDLVELRKTLPAVPFELGDENSYAKNELEFLEDAFDEYITNPNDQTKKDVIMIMLDHFRNTEHPLYIRMLANGYRCFNELHQLRKRINVFSYARQIFISRIFTDKLSISHLAKCNVAEEYSDYEKMFSDMIFDFSIKLKENDDITRHAFKMGDQDESTIIGLIARNKYFTDVQCGLSREIAGCPIQGWVDFTLTLGRLGVNTQSDHFLYNQGSSPMSINACLQKTSFLEHAQAFPAKYQVLMFNVSEEDKPLVSDPANYPKFIHSLSEFSAEQKSGLAAELLSGNPRSRFCHFISTQVLTGNVFKEATPANSIEYTKIFSKFFLILFDESEIPKEKLELYTQLPVEIKVSLGLKHSKGFKLYLSYMKQSDLVTFDDAMAMLNRFYVPGDAIFNFETISLIASHFDIPVSSVYHALPENIQSVLLLLSFLEGQANEIFPSKKEIENKMRQHVKSITIAGDWIATLDTRIKSGKANIRDIVFYLALNKGLSEQDFDRIAKQYLNKETPLMSVEHNELVDALLVLDAPDVEYLKKRIGLLVLTRDSELKANIKNLLNQSHDNADRNLIFHIIRAGGTTAKPKSTTNAANFEKCLNRSNITMNEVYTLFQYTEHRAQAFEASQPDSVINYRH